MTAAQVVVVLDALDAVGCRAWVGGGWGVDALVGRQTRPHRDLDVVADAAVERAALAALGALGYAVETDWRPVRVELGAPGLGWVDLHPMVLDAAGNGVQAGPAGASFVYPAECFVTGTIAGRPVGCLSVERQVLFHSGYEPREVDRADLALLQDLLEGTAPGPMTHA